MLVSNPNSSSKTPLPSLLLSPPYLYPYAIRANCFFILHPLKSSSHFIFYNPSNILFYNFHLLCRSCTLILVIHQLFKVLLPSSQNALWHILPSLVPLQNLFSLLCVQYLIQLHIHFMFSLFHHPLCLMSNLFEFLYTLFCSFTIPFLSHQPLP